MVQVHAPLEYLERYEVLWPVVTEDPTRGIVSERLLEKSVQNGEVDFSCVIVGVECFQSNAFQRRVSVSIAMRFSPPVRAAEFSLRTPRVATSRLRLHVTAETLVEVLHRDNRSIINQH